MAQQQIQAAVQVALGANGAEALVGGLLSAEGEQRSQSEKVLDAMTEQHPNECVVGLVRVLRQGGGAVERALCATLLRKILTKGQPPVWPSLAAASQQLVKAELLNVMKEEKDRDTLRQTGDLIAELICKVLGNETWPEVIPFLSQSISSGVVLNMEMALLMLADMVEGIKDAILPNLDQYCGALATCMGRPEAGVKLASLKALKSFIVVFDDDSERVKFQTAAPELLKIPDAVRQQGDNDPSRQAYSELIDLAEDCPEFWQPCLPSVTQTMINNSKAPNVPMDDRMLAMEFLLSLMESSEDEDAEPVLKGVLPELLAVLLEFMLDVEDVPQWHLANDEEHQDEGHGDHFMFGEIAVDRLAKLVGGKAMMPVLGQMVPVLLGDQDWKKRHAVFTCVGQMAEGCTDDLLQDMGTLVSICVKGCQDPHPKVRWSACQAIGLLVDELGEHLGSSEFHTILTALHPLFKDKSSPRVQAHAVLCMVDFIQDCKLEVVQPSLDDVVATVIEIMPGAPYLVRDASLKFLSSAAGEIEAPEFAKYYTAVMGTVNAAMGQAVGEKSPEVFAMMLHTMAMVGRASGPSCFSPDCPKMMVYYKDIVQATVQSEDSEADKRDVLEVLHDVASIVAECMGRAFVEYMPLVMPSLMEAVKLQPSVKLFDPEESMSEEEAENIDIVEMDGKLVAVDAKLLDYKAAAIETITALANVLREDFMPNAAQVAELVTPLCNYVSHAEVRQAAIEQQPALLSCALDASRKSGDTGGQDASFAQGLLGVQWPALVQHLADYEKADFQATAPYALESLGKIMGLLGTNLNEEMIGKAVDRVKPVLECFDGLRQDRLQAKPGDLDEEELEDLEEELELEITLYDKLETFVNNLLKILSDRASAWLETILPHLTPLLDKRHRPELQQMAVVLTTDVCEFAPATGQKYVTTLLPIFLEACASDHAGLRQCAAYGVGVVAQKHIEIVKPFAAQTLAKLMEVANRPESRTEEYQSATDNIISAIGKIIEHHSDVVDARMTADTWLKFLPLKSDIAEAVVVHDQLIRMIEKRDVKVLGEANQNLPQVVPVMMGVLAGGDKLVSQDGARRMVGLLQQMQSGIPQDIVEGTFNRMSPQEQENLKSYMATQG
ncbi:unnamed protein product [Ostreobium quekettii]|uniref:IPO4/5-like TPR repeats domain-containing protein n=1 Tax=Ostreobium quekettii TaxID=121088 RepID=A0A8S1IW66_9CHLO|nr:unnamed protein product [Ostreobium quekettii]|eukprot:evm.model.scf_243.12 EVM.evm.TU.scf_243.12   scf_243:96157-109287(+)